MVDIKILNREIKNGDLVIGTRSVIKAIKKNEISKVYVSNDILMNLFLEIEKEAKAKNVKIFKLDQNKEQLKELCKKPFFISVYAIKKGNEGESGKESGESEESEEPETKEAKEEIREKSAEKPKIKKENKEEKEDTHGNKVSGAQKARLSSEKEAKKSKSEKSKAKSTETKVSGTQKAKLSSERG